MVSLHTYSTVWILFLSCSPYIPEVIVLSLSWSPTCQKSLSFPIPGLPSYRKAFFLSCSLYIPELQKSLYLSLSLSLSTYTCVRVCVRSLPCILCSSPFFCPVSIEVFPRAGKFLFGLVRGRNPCNPCCLLATQPLLITRYTTKLPFSFRPFFRLLGPAKLQYRYTVGTENSLTK